jgi:iron complex transport system ATP-binding protein
MSVVFTVRDLDFCYPGASRDAVRGVSLEVPEGGFVALLGPNGSGKSTLLKLMLGELGRSAGEVAYLERPIESWPRREVARRVAFVPQAEPLAFPMTVRALVEMGRYPHVGVLGRPGPEDAAAVESAMVRAGVIEFAERSVTHLSGGERQRARIARALAQEPSTLVLDEPTAALDLHYEMETFELLRHLSHDAGFTVLVATHNLNLAARYASRLALLAEGEVQAAGDPEAVLQRETIERVYRWPVVVSSHPGPGPDASAPQVIPLSRPPGGKTNDGEVNRCGG